MSQPRSKENRSAFSPNPIGWENHPCETGEPHFITTISDCRLGLLMSNRDALEMGGRRSHLWFITRFDVSLQRPCRAFVAVRVCEGRSPEMDRAPFHISMEVHNLTDDITVGATHSNYWHCAEVAFRLPHRNSSAAAATSLEVMARSALKTLQLGRDRPFPRPNEFSNLAQL